MTEQWDETMVNRGYKYVGVQINSTNAFSKERNRCESLHYSLYVKNIKYIYKVYIINNLI